MLKHLKRCQLVAKNSVIPYIDGQVWIQVSGGAGTIQATDLQSQYLGRFKSTWPDMSVIVDIKQLTTALTLIPEPVVTFVDGQLLLSGNGAVSIPTIAPIGDDGSNIWPTFDPIDSDRFPVDPAKIQTLSKFVSKDQLRPQLTGVFLGPNGSCATDCHALVWFTDHCYPGAIIIPQNVCKLATSELASNETHGCFYSDEYELTFRQCEGKYPPFHDVIPAPVDTKYEFGPVLPCLVDNNLKRFYIAEGVFTMSDIDLGFEVSIPAPGLPDIGFNSEIFKKVAELGTEFEVSASDRAAVIRKPGMVALAMPIFNSTKD
jgi:hypothetical protein